MSRITWKKTYGYAMAYTQNTNQHSKDRHKIKYMKMQNYNKLLASKTKHNPSIYLPSSLRKSRPGVSAPSSSSPSGYKWCTDNAGIATKHLDTTNVKTGLAL